MKTKTKMYVKFTENNDWEGETWCWYIPVEGNKESLEVLRDKVKKVSTEADFYELGSKKLTEQEVDTLVKNANDDCGYMDGHNKVTYNLDVSELVPLKTPEDIHDALYKGGLFKSN